MGLANTVRNATLVEVAEKGTSLTMDSTCKATRLWCVPAEGKGIKKSAAHCGFLQDRDVVGWSPPRANGCVAPPRVSHIAPANVHLYWGFVGGRELQKIKRRLAVMHCL